MLTGVFLVVASVITVGVAYKAAELMQQVSSSNLTYCILDE